MTLITACTWRIRRSGCEPAIVRRPESTFVVIAMDDVVRSTQLVFYVRNKDEGSKVARANAQRGPDGASAS